MEIGRSLRPGDVIRTIPDGEPCVIKYVNQSGAYAVPLIGLQREIKGKQVEFHAPGRTISTSSLVELIGCMEVEENVKMGSKGRGMAKAKSSAGTKGRKPSSEPEGDSHQLLEEVKAEIEGEPQKPAPKRAVASVANDEVKGVPLSSFAYDPKQAAAAGTGAVEATAGGHPAAVDVESSASSEAHTDMAKKEAKAAKAVKAKSNGHANGSAKRDRTPKQVRKCTCGCGAETTGYFAPGHDARFHGWIKKLSDGRMEPKDLPAAVRNGLNLQQTKQGFRAQSPNYFKG